MLAMKLVHLIERHSEALSKKLAEQIRNSDRTSEFRNIPVADLRLAATDVYRNLGEWLLQKTERDIAGRFRAIAARRAAEGISLHQWVWALTLTRDHLWRFLRQEAFADSIFELHAELELNHLLSQFFDRAIYYGVIGYEEEQRRSPKDDLAKAKDWAISVGLLPPPNSTHPERDV